LAAISYDAILVFSILFFAGLAVFPLTRGEISLLYQLYLLAIIYFYFAWSWTHGGQTLGMRSWGVRVEREDGEWPSWRDASIRFGIAIISLACAGLGFARAAFDPQNRAWHDEFSRTRLVFVPKKGAKP
jgi:uncharacterized RDD family membrane protein YckC